MSKKNSILKIFYKLTIAILYGFVGLAIAKVWQYDHRTGLVLTVFFLEFIYIKARQDSFNRDILQYIAEMGVIDTILTDRLNKKLEEMDALMKRFENMRESMRKYYADLVREDETDEPHRV